MKHALLLLALLACAPAAAAQTLFVNSSTPTNATPNVDVATTVSFTFNTAVTLEAAELITVLPEFAVTITDTTLSADGRTISFEVEHRDDTDFYWIVAGATDNGTGGEFSVFLPYLLYYTTAPEVGPYTVRGRVTAGTPEVESTLAGVVLLDRNPFTLAGGIDSALVAGIGVTVPGSGGEFAVRYVREGTVWAIAANSLTLDIGEDDVFGGDPFADVAVGFYDPNGDRVPDPLAVASDRSGIEIPLFPFSSYVQTAAQARVLAEANAEGELIDLTGFGVAEDGRSLFWSYTFYEAGADSAAIVTVVPLFGADVEYMPVDPDFDDLVPLPAAFSTAEAAVAVAEANGGAAYRADNPEALVLVQAGAGARFTLEDTPFEGTEAWVVTYFESFFGDALAVVVDLETGVFLGTLADGPVANEPSSEVPGTIALGVNYPNPFNPATVIPYTLQSSGDVRLGVYDALGREVARLVDGARPAGTYTATWDAAGMPSGVYLVRLEAGGQHRTRAVTLVK